VSRHDGRRPRSLGAPKRCAGGVSAAATPGRGAVTRLAAAVVARPISVGPAALLLAAAAFGSAAGCARAPRPATTPRAAANRPPMVRLSCDPCRVQPGGRLLITALAQDPDGDVLSYAWSSASGGISASGAAAEWVAPAEKGPVPVAVVVTDGRGGTATDAVILTVEAGNPQP